jgi:hypothetical protein
MQGQWIYSSVLLPDAGEAIEFKLEEREQPISGTFAGDVFHSRWADYGRSDVRSWRSLDSDPSARSFEVPTSRMGSFARFFKQLKNITSRSRGRDLITPPREIAETSVVAATTLLAHAIHSNPMYSNQMSS